jgi:hypothetical protein
VQGNHHDEAPGWTAVVTQRLSINCRMTSLAMNSGYRFESMQSSGMRHLFSFDIIICLLIWGMPALQKSTYKVINQIFS